MLDVTESYAKRNDNFATKVIGTENVEKKCKIVRRITEKTSLKLPSLGNY